MIPRTQKSILLILLIMLSSCLQPPARENPGTFAKIGCLEAIISLIKNKKLPVDGNNKGYLLLCNYIENHYMDSVEDLP